MYGETGYHGAYAASTSEGSNGMLRSHSQGKYSRNDSVEMDAILPSNRSASTQCRFQVVNLLH